MTDSFEAWINGMSDNEYEDMLDQSNPESFTDAQREKALNIRSAPDSEELAQLELEQEFVGEPTVQPRGGVTISGERVDIEPEVVSPPASRVSPIPAPPSEKVTPPKPTRRLDRVRNAVSKFFRRFFRV